MFGNLQQQGDTNSNHNMIDFFSCFHHTVNFLDSDFSADFTYGDAFDFDSISSGSFEYDIISCEFSVGGRRCQKKRRKNCVFWVKNIKKIMLVQILHAPLADARNNSWAIQQRLL